MRTLAATARRHVALAWCIVLLVTGTVIWVLPNPNPTVTAMLFVFGAMSLLGGFIAGIVALVQHRRDLGPGVVSRMRDIGRGAW